eukprot:501979-Amorphochlora_amoeboformis.AAC.1
MDHHRPPTRRIWTRTCSAAWSVYRVVSHVWSLEFVDVRSRQSQAERCLEGQGCGHLGDADSAPAGA